MKKIQPLERLQKAVEKELQEYYRQEQNERIKIGIKVKKTKSCNVKNCKV